MRAALGIISFVSIHYVYGTSMDGAQLSLQWCAAKNTNQLFALDESRSQIHHVPSGLCISAPYGSPGHVTLELRQCEASDPAQRWVYNASTSVITGVPPSSSGGCLAWNTEGGPGIEGVNSTVGLWTCSQIGFNSYFAAGYPYSNHLGANYSTPNNQTFSGLCVTATPLPPLPLPTIEQVKWQDDYIACFVHFNMGTAAGTQGCNCADAPPSIETWAPGQVNTDEWIDTGIAMGCSRFIYTAKHSCGFLTWDSQVPASTYNYSVGHNPNPLGQQDIVASFVESARSKGVGVGFYYSVVSNSLLNVCRGVVGPSPKPGQRRVTQEQYNQVVFSHLRELWGNYGPLDEIWFDGGYPASMKTGLQQLFKELQPKVVAFGAVDLMPSPVRWVGTESGYAPYPQWSAGTPSGQGSPDGSLWLPAETDFTLQNSDQWFYNPGAGVRSPQELRSMVETSAGHNTALIIDIAPMPNGSVPVAQQKAAKGLGQYLRACYGHAAGVTSASGERTVTLGLPGSSGTGIDRVMVRENVTMGQLIRSFELVGVTSGAAHVSLFNGTSVGQRFIAVLPQPVDLAQVVLRVTSVDCRAPQGAPFVQELSAFACGQAASKHDEEMKGTSTR